MLSCINLYTCPVACSLQKQTDDKSNTCQLPRSRRQNFFNRYGKTNHAVSNSPYNHQNDVHDRSFFISKQIETHTEYRRRKQRNNNSNDPEKQSPLNIRYLSNIDTGQYCQHGNSGIDSDIQQVINESCQYNFSFCERIGQHNVIKLHPLILLHSRLHNGNRCHRDCECNKKHHHSCSEYQSFLTIPHILITHSFLLTQAQIAMNNVIFHTMPLLSHKTASHLPRTPFLSLIQGIHSEFPVYFLSAPCIHGALF